MFSMFLKLMFFLLVRVLFYVCIIGLVIFRKWWWCFLKWFLGICCRWVVMLLSDR